MDTRFGRPAWLIAGATLALVGSFLLHTLPAFADRLTPEQDIALKQLGLHDLTAYGGAPKLDIWFPGYGDYELSEGSYLYLEQSHSEVVHPVNSTVTVLLNDVPVATTFLTEQNVGRTGWKISLPRDLLKRDLNHVELRYYMRLGEDECKDSESPALYSTIYADSYIHYEYRQPLQFLGLQPPDLGRFPEPFLRPEIMAGKVAFIVPDDPSAADLSAAASIAARFGQLAIGKPFTATLHLASSVDRQLLARRDLVVIGQPDANALLRELAPSLPLQYSIENGQAAYLDESGSPLDPDSGILQEIVSPWDRRFVVLVVSGTSEEGLRRAIRALATRQGAKLLRGPYAIVTKAAGELAREEEAASDTALASISLRQLGLGDWQAKGVAQHTVAFSFDAPPPGQHTAYFDLLLSHSPLLDHDRSSVTISLNGTPVRSLSLKGENAEWYTQRILLPPASLRPGINSMAIQFNLYLRRAEECGALADERAWAVVRADSQLVLPVGAQRPPLSLANLPYPFISNGKPSEVFLVLPEDKALLEESLQVAVMLGRQSLGESAEMQAGFATALDEEAKRSRDIITYGLTDGSGLMSEIKDSLPLALGADWERSLQRRELVLLGVRDAASLGIIQLVPSPWNKDRALLAISGTSPESLRLAGQALATTMPAGNVAIVGDDGKAVGIKIAAEPPPPQPGMLTPQEAYRYVAAAVAVLTLGLLGTMLARAWSSGRPD